MTSRLIIRRNQDPLKLMTVTNTCELSLTCGTGPTCQWQTATTWDAGMPCMATTEAPGGAPPTSPHLPPMAPPLAASIISSSSPLFSTSLSRPTGPTCQWHPATAWMLVCRAWRRPKHPEALLLPHLTFLPWRLPSPPPSSRPHRPSSPPPCPAQPVPRVSDTQRLHGCWSAARGDDWSIRRRSSYLTSPSSHGASPHRRRRLVLVAPLRSTSWRGPAETRSSEWSAGTSRGCTGRASRWLSPRRRCHHWTAPSSAAEC
jgi:hypothetical protein